MISCTEFIPAYSELFTFLEDNYGRQEVDVFWKYLFQPDGKGIPLIGFVEREGIRGCFSYWSGTLSEEASDCTLQLNEKGGWFKCTMHKCPSKGRLLELQKEIGIKPYHDYCLHCDSYRSATEKVGLDYIFNFDGVDHAACSLFIYDPKVFDGRIIVDENTETLEIRAAEKEYFHPDFHSSLNMGVAYVGDKYGKDVLQAYLSRYTKNVYKKVLTERTLKALADQILDTYQKEKAPDAVKLDLQDNSLQVTVSYCPGVKHLRKTGREVSKWYRYTTEFVMATLAEELGLSFTMDSYDEATGKACYHFTK